MTGLVVITGAAGALGSAIVGQFLADGRTIAALDRAGPRLDTLAAGAPDGRVHPVGVELTDRAAVHSAWQEIDRFGEAQALVNVAGAFASGSLADTDESVLAAMVDTNVATALWSSQAGAERLAAAGGGAIVNIGSRTAITGRGPVAYAAAKSAVVRVTQVLADELRAQRIRVNAVLPSIIDTPANRADMPKADPAKWVAPDDLAAVILFLASEEARAVTGALVPVTGRG